MSSATSHWTNQSVLDLAHGADPIDVMTAKARGIVLDAVERGWDGPPFDPFQLAELLGILVQPSDDVPDARLVPAESKRARIEFNPNRPPGRMRFSVAHEIAHTLFPDHPAIVRNRSHQSQSDSDEWQVELLCNVAAAEFLIPIGTAFELEETATSIDNLMRLRKEFDVSTEAILLRAVKLTSEPCAVFAAVRSNGASVPKLRVDYTIPSRGWKEDIPRGLEFEGPSAVAECTAVGFTAKRTERWLPQLPEFQVECVGSPPYPGHRYPRILGILHREGTSAPARRGLLSVIGDATQPRGTGRCIIAHIVNDKTPNWGGAFARDVRLKWPSTQDAFRHWVIGDKANLSLGSIHVSTVSDGLSVVSMVAQHGYGPSSTPRIRYGALRECLDHMATLSESLNASVHMPRIGAGQAGGHWGIISELLDEALVRRGIDVTIYNLPTEQPPRETQGLLPLNASQPSA